MSQDVRYLLMPSRTYFGPGAVSKVADAVGTYSANRIAVVTDKGVKNAGLLQVLLDQLEKSSARVEVFDGAEPEPTLKSAENAADAMLSAGGCDLVVSLGGGSAMDVAKCANVIYANGGSILDYEDGSANQKAIERVLPHIDIPTTAGTGSEATIWAVYIDPQRRFKTAIQDPRLIANVAILDPEMTRTMPRSVTAATGLDALTHAIEAYVSIHSSPATEAYCKEAILLVAKHLQKAVEDGQDIEARSGMLMSSFMAGSAFSNSSLGICHTLAEALGGYYRIPHGVTNALMLPHVMRFNLSANPEKFAAIARLMGEATEGIKMSDSAPLSIHAVSKLCEEVDLPRRLREVGVRREDLGNLADMADRWANVSGNPREISRAQILEMFEKAY